MISARTVASLTLGEDDKEAGTIVAAEEKVVIGAGSDVGCLNRLLAHFCSTSLAKPSLFNEVKIRLNEGDSIKSDVSSSSCLKLAVVCAEDGVSELRTPDSCNTISSSSFRGSKYGRHCLALHSQHGTINI